MEPEGQQGPPPPQRTAPAGRSDRSAAFSPAQCVASCSRDLRYAAEVWSGPRAAPADGSAIWRTILATQLGTRTLQLQPGNRVIPDSPFTLVLSGGGLKGLAHIGVLRALEERGL